MKNHPLRQVWQNMKQRCYNPKSQRYQWYGAKGINICDEWLNPENFIKWALDNGWQKGLQIDRIDNNGNYEPNNCRFVTRIENANNRTTSVKLTHSGNTLTINQWGEKLNVPGKLILQRIARGWSIEDALTKEFKRNKNKNKNKPIICLNTGKRYDSFKTAAKELNLCQGSIGKVLSKKRQSTGGYIFELAL